MTEAAQASGFGKNRKRQDGGDPRQEIWVPGSSS
jgi:hypothetical protein